MNSFKAQLCTICRKKVDQFASFMRTDYPYSFPSLGPDRILLSPVYGTTEPIIFGNIPPRGFVFNFEVMKNFQSESAKKKKEEETPLFLTFSPKREAEDSHPSRDGSFIFRKSSDNTLLNRPELSDYSMSSFIDKDESDSKGSFR